MNKSWLLEGTLSTGIMTDSDSILSAGTKTEELEDSIAELTDKELARLVEETK